MTPESRLINPFNNKKDIEEAIRRAWQAVQRAARESLTQEKLLEAQSVAEDFGIDVEYKPVNGPAVVFRRSRRVYPNGRQPERQEPTGQK